MKKFEEIWKEANEEADLKYDPKGVLARSLFLYSALKERIEPFLEKQQPDIPEFVAEGIESIPHHYTAFGATLLVKEKIEITKGGNINRDWLPLYNWLFSNNEINSQDLFSQAWLNGYTVAKEKRFYLKHKSVLIFDPDSDDSDVDELYLGAGGNFVPYQHLAKIFTQSQIDSMETGSYEQIEVTE